MKTGALILLLFLLGIGVGSVVELPSMQAAAPTPSPGAMTIYMVSNPNTSVLTTTHTFANALSTPVHSMVYPVPAVSTAIIHVRDIPQITSPFSGTVRIEADLPYSAEVIDYDYPPTNTPTTTPTRTPTVTPTPTPTHVVILLPILK